jgi:hypothetical protein
VRPDGVRGAAADVTEDRPAFKRPDKKLRWLF